ncbi:ganglioside-induced differentiation-associated protein 1 isoform X1 [Drosophila teissieri]|uniref:ganglioside-induced differentiation-associated protein 1 isoform X1 n=1 Tax=Drosophila teissieri TaxID=7243 RepID=UPI001CBA12B6|nr:ganglioside-induced differentiation-associated protein 1 isoform X1 [Drosophila teissieri]
MSEQTKEIEALPPTLQDFKAPDLPSNKPVLFFHPYNFHAQKVLMVLYEKRIDFFPYVVDLCNGEQYSNWFLNLNPKGDVPVLQDGALVIPSSTHIINYVESKFRGDRSLKPAHNSKEFDQMLVFEQAIARLPVGTLSLGSFMHDDLKLVPKAPFIGPVRQSCLKNNEKVLELLRHSVDDQATNKATLQHKLDIQLRRLELASSREDFQKVLDAVRHFLLYVEQELSAQAPRSEWLTGDELNVADISLGLLLHRLYQLGFENQFWTFGKLPQVEAYFLRFRQRESFHRLQPSNFAILREMWTRTPGNYKLGAGAGFLGMAMFAAFAHK